MSTLWQNRLSKVRFRPGVRNRRAQFGIEALEHRLALSVTANLVNGQLVIASDTAADTIQLDHNSTQTVVFAPGQLFRSFVDSQITNGIVINAGGGDDTVNLLATVKPVTVNGQGGTDKVNIGKDKSAQAIQAPLT